MKPFPSLETERLLLDSPRAADIPRIVEFAADEGIAEYTLNIPHPYEEKDAISWLNMAHQGYKDGLHHVFAMRLKPGGEFIGGIGLVITRRFRRAEMGYWIGRPFWNQGYTSEAMQAVMKYGFETLKLNKLYAIHLHENLASGKVMLKNGMQREGLLKEHVYKNEQYFDVIQYGLTKGQYEGSRLSVVSSR